MKRIFALLLAALTLLGLTACGEPSDAGPDSPAAENDMDRAKIWLEARIEEDELFSFDYGEVPFPVSYTHLDVYKRQGLSAYPYW